MRKYKMINRLSALLLAAMMLLCCLPAAAEENGTGTAAAPEETTEASSESILQDMELGMFNISGFTSPFPMLPLPNEADQYSDTDYWFYTADESAPYEISCNVQIFEIRYIAEDRERAELWYSENSFSGRNVEVLVTEETEIDGHPARLYLLRVKGSMGESCQGVIQYIRDSKQFRLRLLTEPQNGTAWEQLPKVTMADMRRLAKEVHYEPTGEDITLADGELTITAKGDLSVLSAGKKLQFTAAFADPAKVKAVDKSLEAEVINWAVADAETGEAAEGVSINEKGLLTVDKNLASAKKVIVKCGAPFFKTLAEYPLTVLPTVSAITTDPEEIVFFAGTDTAAEVKAVLEPGTVPLLGIAWQLKKEGTVEMTPGEDGTATFRPLAAGKTTVTVTEPGGKKYTLKVSVVEPVTAVDLTCSGKPVPGGTVTVKAALTPKNAGVKDVKWVLVTGAEVAEINEKGQVKISKDAPHGTLISISCEALGASEHVYGLTAFNVE